MSNNTSTLVVVGMAAIMILCASTVAIIALNSNNNGSFMSADERDFHEGYADGYAEAQTRNADMDTTFLTLTASNANFKLVGADEITTLGINSDNDDDDDEDSETADMAKIRGVKTASKTFEQTTGSELLEEGEAAEACDLPVQKRSEAYWFGFDLGFKDGSSVNSTLGLNDNFSLFLNREKTQYRMVSAEEYKTMEDCVEAA